MTAIACINELMEHEVGRRQGHLCGFRPALFSLTDQCRY